MSVRDVLSTKTLGTTVQVVVKVYANGDIEFTAAGVTRTIYSDDPAVKALVEALGTVA